jgi:phospholipase A1
MKRTLVFLLVTFSIAFSVAVEAQDIKSAYESLHQSKFAVLPHYNTFILPIVHNWSPHEDLYEGIKTIDPKGRGSQFYKKDEAEFQISFAVPVIRELGNRKWDVLFAYTHHAWWQVYNSAWSRPFRETNYMPELFARYFDVSTHEWLGLKFVAVDAGYVHQSNGQIQIISRSWDRFFFRSYFQSQYFHLVLSGWTRLHRRRALDDNPDITKYMGIGDVELIKDFGDHRAYLKVPLATHQLSFDLKYSFPLEKGLRWYLSYQSGYGHSLIEYNRYSERLGAGIMLENFIF